MRLLSGEKSKEKQNKRGSAWAAKGETGREPQGPGRPPKIPTDINQAKTLRGGKGKGKGL